LDWTPSEVEQSRRDSHHDRLFEPKLATPTPESVRELTFNGSPGGSYLLDLTSPCRCKAEFCHCPNSNSHSTSDPTETEAELDILDTPFNSSIESTGAKPYTGFLGVPDEVDQTSSPVLSVISDAGDQQQKRQKRTLAQDSSFHSGFNLEESLASLPAEHELQENILAARAETRNNEGQKRRFIPKEKLCHVVNAESVARELMKKLSHIHSDEQIKTYAREICRETEITRNNKRLIKSYRKIFALLVLVDATSSIPLFLEEDVSDLELPMTLVKLEGTGGHYRQGDPYQKPLKCFKHKMWSPFKLEEFQEKQWLMLAPFFSKDGGAIKHYVLQDEHILPFLPLTSTDEASGHIGYKTGGYGKVLMVRIHDEHHNFQDATLHGHGFAIKQQLHDDRSAREAYKKEIDILKMFTKEQSHKHVVSLLASYEQFKKFHLIFYRAGGDLFEYWRVIQRNPQITYDNVLWMAEQCPGLADALSKLHRHLSFPKRQRIAVPHEKPTLAETADHFQKHTKKRVDFVIPHKDSWGIDGIKERPPSPIAPLDQPPLAGDGHPRALRRSHSDDTPNRMKYGRHGDINPGNILWYGDNRGDGKTLSGTLKITDFGQAELNSTVSKTKRQSVAMTMTYRPPECDFQPRIIRQSYDIWCLGCVFLEFVTWMLGGETLLNGFILKRWTPDALQQNNSRSDIFFKIERQTGSHQLKAIIKPEVSKFIDELHEHPNCTEYFHELLVMIQHDMLVVESSERKSCAGIWKRLDHMHERCHRERDYAVASNPWCRLMKKQPPPRNGKTENALLAVQNDRPNLPTKSPALPSFKRCASRIPRPKPHYSKSSK
jgi:serine/threonine protein kinase